MKNFCNTTSSWYIELPNEASCVAIFFSRSHVDNFFLSRYVLPSCIYFEKCLCLLPRKEAEINCNLIILNKFYDWVWRIYYKRAEVFFTNFIILCIGKFHNVISLTIICYQVSKTLDPNVSYIVTLFLQNIHTDKLWNLYIEWAPTLRFSWLVRI